MYGKIFASMYTGTLYGQWQALVTMQQLIVLADADGIVDMTPPAIAAVTSIPLEIIKQGLDVLAAPDEYTRTPGSDGKRIELIDAHRPWGWHIVNHAKYRDITKMEEVREQTRQRVARHRASKTVNADVTGGNASNAIQTQIHTQTQKADTPPLRGVRLPHDSLPDDWKAFCSTERTDLDPAATFDIFKDYWKAQPGRHGVKLDWFATWRNWVRSQKRPPGAPVPAARSVAATEKCGKCKGTLKGGFTYTQTHGNVCASCWSKR